MGASDPDAKKVLDAVSAKFKTYKSVQAKFYWRSKNASGKILVPKTGTVYMKGTKYRISVTGRKYIVMDQNVDFDKASKEVTINKIDPSANSITPQKLFTNLRFSLQAERNVSMNGKSMWNWTHPDRQNKAISQSVAVYR